MSQHDLYAIIRQQQKQLAAIQAQIQVLIARVGGVGAERRVEGSNTGSHMEVVKPSTFNGKAGKVGGFVTACKLYLRIKMRKVTVEEQIQ